MNDKNQGGITEIVSIGSANFEILKRFFLERGLGSVDENGNFSTIPMSIEEFSEINEKLAEFLDRNESNTLPDNGGEQVKPLDLIPLIKATTHRVKEVLVERTSIGRKLNDKAALPALYEYKDREIVTHHATKKGADDIVAVVSLSFEALQEWESFLPANKKITPFAYAVLRHCMTLIATGNEYTSTKIFFRQMNGGSEKAPTENFREAFYQALSLLACTRIKIDARKEHKEGYNERDYYEGALLPNSISGSEIVTINGSIVEDVIHFLGQSPLFEYGKAKGQITPLPLGMYNTPSVNSTEENIVIREYLIGFFADIINPHSPVQPIISYDTLYEYLGVDESNPKQTRKNKAKIRATVRAILSDWVEGKYIKGFRELTANNKPVKERVKAAKVILDLFTKKEFKRVHKSGNILPAT